MSFGHNCCCEKYYCSTRSLWLKFFPGHGAYQELLKCLVKTLGGSRQLARNRTLLLVADVLVSSSAAARRAINGQHFALCVEKGDDSAAAAAATKRPFRSRANNALNLY
jgi:hypothetical protein